MIKPSPHKVYKIHHFTMLLDLTDGTVMSLAKNRNGSYRSTLITNSKLKNLTYAAYVAEENLPTKKFNGHLYAQLFGKTFNIGNGNEVHSNDILRLFND